MFGQYSEAGQNWCISSSARMNRRPNFIGQRVVGILSTAEDAKVADRRQRRFNRQFTLQFSCWHYAG